MMQDKTLIDIHVMLARLEQQITAMDDNLRGIKDDIKEMKLEFLRRSEAELQFESHLSMIRSLEEEVKKITAWQMSETKRAGEDRNTTDNTLNMRIISWQGGIIAAAIAFITWIIEQFVFHK